MAFQWQDADALDRPPATGDFQWRDADGGQQTMASELQMMSSHANSAIGLPEDAPSILDRLKLYAAPLAGPAAGLHALADLTARKNPRALMEQETNDAAMLASFMVPAARAIKGVGPIARLARVAQSGLTNAAWGAGVGAVAHMDDKPLEHAVEDAATWGLFGAGLHGAGEAVGATWGVTRPARAAVGKWMTGWAKEPGFSATLPAFGRLAERQVTEMPPAMLQLAAARRAVENAARRAKLVGEDGKMDRDLVDEIRTLMPTASADALEQAKPQELWDTARTIRYLHDKSIASKTAVDAVNPWIGRGNKSIAQFVTETGANILNTYSSIGAMGPARWLRVMGAFSSSFKRWADQYGTSGKYIAKMLDDHQRAAIRFSAPLVDRIQLALKPLRAHELENFVDVVQGEDVPVSQAVSHAAKEWEAIRQEVAKQAGEAGVMKYVDGKWEAFKPRDVYFPRFYTKSSLAALPKPELDQLLADYKVQSVDEFLQKANARRYTDPLGGQQSSGLAKIVSGNLQRSRWTNAPGYERDPRKVLPLYLLKAGQSVKATQMFGPQQEVLRGALQSIERRTGSGVEMRLFSDVIRKAVGGWADPTWNDLYNLGSSLQVASKIKLGATLKHFPGQLLNTLITSGTHRSYEAALQMLERDPKMQRMVRDSGVLLRDALPQLTEWDDLPGGKLIGAAKAMSTFTANATMLTPAMRVQRAHAALVGFMRAQEVTDAIMGELAKSKGVTTPRLKRLTDALASLGIHPETVIARGGQLTRDELLEAGLKTAFDTQLMSRIGDLPPMMHNQIGRFLYLFKSAAFQQAIVNKRLIMQPFVEWIDSRGRAGSPKPLIKWLARAGFDHAVTANLIAQSRMWFNGTDQRGDEAANALIDAAHAANGAGLLGLWADILEAAGRKDKTANTMVATLGGPIIYDVADAVQSTGRSIEELNPRPLLGFGAAHVPLAGTRLRNWIDPHDN